MRVLVACEISGTVRDAFRALGHEAYSCDIQYSDHAYHINADAEEIAYNQQWDMMIAHPPCTYLSFAGMAHWNKPGRAERREHAMRFFMALVNAPIKHIAIENPNGYPMVSYRKPDQVIEPYYFGDNHRKRTLLWLKNLPPLWYGKPGQLWSGSEAPKPIYIDASGQNRYFTDSISGSNHQQSRSKTFPGIAHAMAAQWSEYYTLTN